MTTIIAPLAPGRSIAATSFADLTNATVTVGRAEGDMLVVTLTPDVTARVATSVRCRIISRTTTEETLRRTIATALAATPSTERTASLVDSLAKLALEVP